MRNDTFDVGPHIEESGLCMACQDFPNCDRPHGHTGKHRLINHPCHEFIPPDEWKNYPGQGGAYARCAACSNEEFMHHERVKK